MDVDDLRELSDDELRRLQARLLALVPDVTHSERLTYDQAGERLGGIKYERIAALVSQGILIAEKDKPRDAHKRISSDQVAWYRLKQQGEDEGLPNPALLSQEAARRAALPQPQPIDTWAELRRYVAEHMAGSTVSERLNATITEIAQHITGEIVRDTLGMESLPDEERTQLTALLSALTSKGR